MTLCMIGLVRSCNATLPVMVGHSPPHMLVSITARMHSIMSHRYSVQQVYEAGLFCACA